MRIDTYDGYTRLYIGNRKIEISKGVGLSLKFYHSECTIGFHAELPGLFSIFIPLFNVGDFPKDMQDSWGFSWLNGKGWGFWESIHFNWGDKCKVVYMPWASDWVRTSYLLQSGEWWHETHKDRRANTLDGYTKLREAREAAGIWREVHPYTYTRNNGQVQERTATISVEEREWRPRICKWLGLPFWKEVRRTIDIEFSDEVGERTGSWKGGVIGCSYTLKPDETPLECLRRMEREQRFER